MEVVNRIELLFSAEFTGLDGSEFHRNCIRDTQQTGYSEGQCSYGCSTERGSLNFTISVPDVRPTSSEFVSLSQYHHSVQNHPHLNIPQPCLIVDNGDKVSSEMPAGKKHL